MIIHKIIQFYCEHHFTVALRSTVMKSDVFAIIIERLTVSELKMYMQTFFYSELSFRIEYWDQSQAPAGGWHHDFRPDSEPNAKPNLFFLYRHDHYEILYPRA